MQQTTESIAEIARTFSKVACEGLEEAAKFFGTLPDEAWSGPTGCANWNMRTLADHLLGEAVWFPNLVRGVTQGEAPLPMQTYEDIKTISTAELSQKLTEGAWATHGALATATEADLQDTVDLGFAKMPLWRATSIAALEGALHNWDAHAERDKPTTLPTHWATALAGTLPGMAGFLAHSDGVAEFPGTYLLRVGDGIGPVTIVVAATSTTATSGETYQADATLTLNADQYVRLMTGRFRLNSTEAAGVGIEGDRAQAIGLNRVFGGIANG